MNVRALIKKLLVSGNIPTILLPCIGIFYGCSLHAQDINDYLQKTRNAPRIDLVKTFYELNHYQFAWINNSYLKELAGIINGCDTLALNREDYSIAVNLLKTASDSIDADIRITDAAIHFFSDLKIGNKIPSFGYNGLRYSPDVSDIPHKLHVAIRNNDLAGLAMSVQPNSLAYQNMKTLLSWFVKIQHEEDNWIEAHVSSRKADTSNKPLIKRLYELGIIRSGTSSITNNELKDHIKSAQVRFDAMNDGILRSTILSALNFSIRQRKKELDLSINYLRWLKQIQNSSSVLILNIPSATLNVFDHGANLISSKVIVGKPLTPTPSLTGTITEVILYPYWLVPHKIASRELLPSIKRNIAFLENGNYQVLNKNGNILDPYKIPWQKLSSGYFPYIIRQSTGCDNALGLVKFDFYNPFSVYLHDTPGKYLFSFNKRYYSHGCMRVEKPMELAHLLLGSNKIAIDTLTAKGCINQQSPIIVPAERKLPVIILYSTAWYNETGEVVFYDDVYGKLNM